MVPHDVQSTPVESFSPPLLDETMDNPVISQKHSPISPAQSTHLPISNASPDSDQRRLFLDICSGHRAPLSNAILQQHGDVVQFDLLVHAADDLLDDVQFSKLLKLGASGLVAYCDLKELMCPFDSFNHHRAVSHT